VTARVPPAAFRIDGITLIAKLDEHFPRHKFACGRLV
jgi:hypothetical protein